jgi:hypothetical protein
MTNTVTQINHYVDKQQIARMFMEFKGRYFHAWTSIAKTDQDIEFFINLWFQELRNFTIGQLYRAKTEAFLIYENFPPKLGELVSLCLKASGMPDVSEVIRMMIDKRLDHPISKMIYDKIGSWKLSNGTEKEIREQASIAYQQAVIDFTSDQPGHWKRLESFNEEKLRQLPSPDKIPTPGESKAFRDCMDKCREILGVKLSSADKPAQREFDEEKISPTNRSFDQKYYNEFRDYLLSIREEDTYILQPKYAYRRMKLIAAKGQPEFLRKAGYNPNPQGTDKTPPIGSGGPRRAYTNYGGD